MKKTIICLFSTFLVFTMLGMEVTLVNAETSKIYVDGKKYVFDDKSHYEIDENSLYDSINDATNGDNGRVSIEGELTNLAAMNGFPAYGVNGGNVSFSYEVGSIAEETEKDQWHIVEDKSKTINDFKISSNIGKLALILQTSQDGSDWTIEKTITNVMNGKQDTSNLYTTKRIQLVSGYYYRIIVVYETSRKTGENTTLFIKTDKFENKKNAEIFEFYLLDTKSSSLISDSTVSKTLGKKTRTSKNEGYYGSKAINNDDPHFGWDLGEFFVSGYTDDVYDDQGNIVFLKNVGDQVTLWFNLKQDIDRLNGNDRLRINADKDGYDRDFEVQKTNFGKGALLIRKTDYQNRTSKPEIYTNYLEANANTDANTVVGLFEEGDYEVALDYEIKNTPRKVGNVEVIPEYSDYTIRFKFSIRNSNCMVFPFDIESGKELINTSITPSGFKLDLARSRYLTVTVQKFNVSKTSNEYVMDERFNRAAKDGDSYNEEGVYIFNVANEYTKEKTTKTIYVGSSPIIKALASGKTLAEINKAIKNGGKIDANGEIWNKN